MNNNTDFQIPASTVIGENNKYPIIDIRDDWERQISSLPNTINYPMNTVPQKKSEISELANNNDKIYVLCHHGVRSLQTAVLLRNMGINNVFSIAGGIHQWSECDPSVTKY